MRNGNRSSIGSHQSEAEDGVVISKDDLQTERREGVRLQLRRDASRSGRGVERRNDEETPVCCFTRFRRYEEEEEGLPLHDVKRQRLEEEKSRRRQIETKDTDCSRRWKDRETQEKEEKEEKEKEKEKEDGSAEQSKAAQTTFEVSKRSSKAEVRDRRCEIRIGTTTFNGTSGHVPMTRTEEREKVTKAHGCNHHKTGMLIPAVDFAAAEDEEEKKEETHFEQDDSMGGEVKEEAGTAELRECRDRQSEFENKKKKQTTEEKGQTKEEQEEEWRDTPTLVSERHSEKQRVDDHPKTHDAMFNLLPVETAAAEEEEEERRGGGKSARTEPEEKNVNPSAQIHQVCGEVSLSTDDAEQRRAAENRGQKKQKKADEGQTFFPNGSGGDEDVCRHHDDIKNKKEEKEEEVEEDFRDTSESSIVRILRMNPGFCYIPMISPDAALDKVVDLITDSCYPHDFCWSPFISAQFVSALLFSGFIPLGYELSRRRRRHDEGYNSDDDSCRCKQRVIGLLPKLHTQRCVLNPHQLHIPKKALKRSKLFALSFDSAFEDVIQGCVTQHGENWLYPPIRKVLKELFLRRQEEESVRLHSVEVWRDNCLVAGEIGFSVGQCFTSLTGFSTVDSAGTVQLCSLGVALAILGFGFWDLGMEIDYKLTLGAQTIPRRDFVTQFREARAKPSVSLKLSQPKTNCADLLKRMPKKKDTLLRVG